MFRGITGGKGIATKIFRAVAGVTALTMAWLSGPQLAFAKPKPRPKPVSILKPGLTQTPDAALRQKIAAREAAERKKPKADARPLTDKEMKMITGRGPYRNAYFAGTMPWHRSLRDVNLCTGNLFKSFTDIQIAPGRGAGLVLQRTYSSNDDREGPFGIGWTHAYDIRVEDTATPEVDPNTGNEYVPCTDFFGGKHKYQRDADGLYTPPAYMFDELDSKYDEFLVNGPPEVLEDTQKGMDGTVKHFISGGTDADGSPSRVRVCDYIEDRHGNRTTLDYGMTVTYPDGRTEKKLTKVTDPVGRELNFTWLNLGTSGTPQWRITQVLGPTGTYRVTYDYDADKNLSAVHLDADGLNRTTTYGYTSYTDQYGSETGLLSSITDPLGHTVSYVYTLTQPGYYLPHYTGTLWVTGITEPAGVDSGSQPRTLTWTIIPPPGPNYLGEYFVQFGNNAGVPYAMFVVDGQLRKKEMRINQAVWHAPRITNYDTMNNVVDEYVSHLVQSSSSGNPSSGERVIRTFGPHGNVLTERMEGFTGTTIHTYNDISKYFQKASVTDSMGRTSTFDYFDRSDPSPGNRGNVKWVRDAGYAVSGHPNYGKQFEYAYNQYGQKVWEKNLKGVVTTFAYGDSWGNLTTVVQDPDDAATSYVGLKRTTTMLYNVSGLVLGTTDPNGQSSTFTYNTLEQPLTATLPTSVQSIAGEIIYYSYGSNGRMETITDGRGTTTMAYETGCDRVSSITDPVTGTISYTYGIDGERRTVGLPGGGTVTYNFSTTAFMATADDPNSLARVPQGIEDDQGRMVTIEVDSTGRPTYVRFNQTFNTSGQLVSSCKTDYLYDTGIGQYGITYTRGALKQQTTSFETGGGSGGGGTTTLLYKNLYTLNDAVQRTHNQITDHLGNVRTEQYGYDELYRLTSVNYGDGQTQGYTFDAMGNRLTKTDSATGNESYTFNAANMLLSRTVGGSTGGYTNDANGNTLTGGGRTNTWDSQNRLRQCVTSMGTSTFTHGADGLRRRSVFTPAGGGTAIMTDLALDMQNVVREFVGGSISVTYLMGLSGPMYRRPANATDLRWHVFDGLGSVVAEVDVNGAVTATKKHDVYGLTRSMSGPPTSRHGFVGGLGHVSDDSTGLIYMRARYHDPITGRFISEDAAKQGNNWLLYCNSNPVNYVDADGKEYKERVVVELIRIFNNLHIKMPLNLAIALKNPFAGTGTILKLLKAEIQVLMRGMTNEIVDEAFKAEAEGLLEKAKRNEAAAAMKTVRSGTIGVNALRRVHLVVALRTLVELIEGIHPFAGP